MKNIALVCFICILHNLNAQFIDTTCTMLSDINGAEFPVVICTGDTVRFKARWINRPTPPEYRYEYMVWWDMPDGVEIIDTFNRVEALITFTQPNYYISYSNAANGEGLHLFSPTSNQDEIFCGMYINVQVNDCPPTIRLNNPPLRICVGDSVRYIAQARHMPTDWHWVFEGTNISNADSIVPPFVRYDIAGTYTVKLQASNTAGADSLVHTIEVLPRPTRLYDIELDEQYTIRPSDTLRLHTAYQSDYYNWQPNVSNLACFNCANPLFTATTEGFYPFVCTAGVGECSENNYIGVTVKDDIRYFAPTAFTPNGDGLNELFEIKGYDIDIKSIKIFDRWGNLVYYGEGNGAAWDGANHLSGNYVWLMECTDRYNNQPKTRKGSVMLLR